jgi:hypothetical protein
VRPDTDVTAKSGECAGTGGLMNAQRKYAYRYLLYRAMLDIRPIGWLSVTRFRAWNPLYWRKEARRVQRSGAIADWMHNLALFSALDFDHFDEDRFWRDFEHLQEQYPNSGLEVYHRVFEERLAAASRESSGPVIT